MAYGKCRLLKITVRTVQAGNSGFRNVPGLVDFKPDLGRVGAVSRAVDGCYPDGIVSVFQTGSVASGKKFHHIDVIGETVGIGYRNVDIAGDGSSALADSCRYGVKTILFIHRTPQGKGIAVQYFTVRKIVDRNIRICCIHDNGQNLFRRFAEIVLRDQCEYVFPVRKA